MTRQEFLDGLKAALGGHLGERAVEGHMRYYEEYINAQIRQGRTESEVLQELGNPRLIARSIIDAGQNAQGTAGGQRREDEEETGPAYGAYGNGGHGNGVYGNGGYGNGGYRRRRVPAWLWVLLAVLLFLVLPLLIMFVWWLAPFALLIWFIVILVRTLKNSGRR